MASPLKICIHARLLDGVSGGVQQIVVGLAQGLARLGDGDEEYLFRVYSGAAEWLRPFMGGPCRLWEDGPAPARHSGKATAWRGLLRAAGNAPLLWRLNAWRKGRVPDDQGACERQGIGVVHFPYQEGFLTPLPSLYQPHDLQHLALPENFSPAERGRRERMYRRLCRQSWATVLMSRWGKRDLMGRYGMPSGRVAVVPGGAVTSQYPEHDEAGLAALGKRLGLPPAFAYYPAHTFRHKNHARLIQALAQLKGEGLEIPLLCSGGLTPHHAELLSLLKRSGMEGCVAFTGYLPPEDVAGLYRLARVMVFPSLFEGWGLPLTEAMAAGLPIACSNASCIPEQVGDAALIFEPLDAASIAAALRRLWPDVALRQDLAARGKRRVELFSWESAARTFRALYRQAAGRPLGPGDEARIQEAFLP
jgi:glycosyltransferase involved in cell wall biosynthesis